MDGELAIQKILSDDVPFGAIVGTGTSSRIFYDEAKQTEPMPLTIVSLDAIEPNDNKDGPSDMDFDFVYVYHYSKTKKQCNDMARLAREALDRTSGTYLTVQVQSIQFLTQRSGSEFIVDEQRYFIEQLYKLTINL